MRQFVFLWVFLTVSSAFGVERVIHVRAGEMVIAGGEDLNFGPVQNGKSKAQIFTLINAGTQDISFYEIFFGFTKGQLDFLGNGDFPGAGGTCAGGLRPNEACTFVVVFKPANLGVIKANLRFNYYYGTTLQRIDMVVQGQGALSAPINGNAELSMSETNPVMMAETPVGGVSIVTLNLVNTGTMPITQMSESALSGPFSIKGGFPGQGGSCAAILAVASTCKIVVSFNPTTTGTANGVVQVNYFVGTNAYAITRDVQGTGALPASLVLSDGPSFSFGNVVAGATKTHTLTLTNTGGSRATSIAGYGLAVPFRFVGGSFPGTGGNCSSSLLAGASCQIVIQFSSTGLSTKSDTLEIQYNNGMGVVTISRDVTGTAIAPASLSISDGPTFDFGNVNLGEVATRSFTITNSGGAPATEIREISLSAPYSGTLNDCSPLAAGGTCSILVTFAPSVAGLATETIALDFFNGAYSTAVSRDIAGAGVDSADPCSDREAQTPCVSPKK